MTKKRMLVAGAVVGALAVAGGITGVAVASGGGSESDHRPITGVEYERATAKALEVVGGGRVTETELDDEESYYQVEVTKEDGSQVDVNLDRQYELVKTKTEREAG
jgi:uncharacterized membrane protein YkoI